MAASDPSPSVVIGINPEAVDTLARVMRMQLLASGLFVEQPAPLQEPPTRFERFTNLLWRASYNLTHYPGLVVWAVVSGLMDGWTTAREKWQA